MKLLLIALASIASLGAQIQVSIQGVPQKIAIGNLGPVAKDFQIVRIIACNKGRSDVTLDMARLALESPEVGLLPKALVYNTVARDEVKRPTFLASNFLRFGSSAISMAIASKALSISAPGAGMIAAGGLLGLEVLGAFKDKTQIFSFDGIAEKSIIVQANGCSETLGFAKKQKTLKAYSFTLDIDHSLPLVSSSEYFKDSGITSIPLSGGI